MIEKRQVKLFHFIAQSTLQLSLGIGIGISNSTLEQLKQKTENKTTKFIISRDDF